MRISSKHQKLQAEGLQPATDANCAKASGRSPRKRLIAATAACLLAASLAGAVACSPQPQEGATASAASADAESQLDFRHQGGSSAGYEYMDTTDAVEEYSKHLPDWSLNDSLTDLTPAVMIATAARNAPISPHSLKLWQFWSRQTAKRLFRVANLPFGKWRGRPKGDIPVAVFRRTLLNWYSWNVRLFAR